MNEKIKLLAEQANIQFYNLSTGEGDNPQVCGTPEQLEKFAELIVRECIATVQKRCVGDHNREDAEVMRCVADLKEHWGVEE